MVWLLSIHVLNSKVTLPRDDHGTLILKAYQPVSNFMVFINQTDVSVLPPNAARHQKLILRCSKNSKKGAEIATNIQGLGHRNISFWWCVELGGGH